MKKKTIFIGILVALVIGAGIALSQYFMPHRNVQESNADISITSTKLVQKYLENDSIANATYLSNDGDSKILLVTGKVRSISEDYIGQKVILLMDDGALAGVSVTFLPETNSHITQVKIGDIITIKGVIRSGASYDEDLEMYEHVIIEKSDIIK